MLQKLKNKQLRYKFVTNLALLLLLNLLVKPFYIIGIDAEILKRVGEEAYGNYFALLNFSFLFNIVLDVGITNFNTVNISQNRFLIKKHFAHIISLRVILAVVYFFILLVSTFLVGYNLQQLQLLLLLGFNQMLVSFILYLRSNIAALQLFRQDSIISVLDRIILIFICYILLWGNITSSSFQIKWFIYAQTFSYGLAAMVAYFIVRSHAQKINFSIEKAFAIMIIKKSMPYAILILLMTFYSRIDIILLERLLPDGAMQAGIYAQGFRFFEALSMFSYLFAVLLLPLFSKMIKTKENILPLLNLSCRILLTGAIVMATTFIFYSHQILTLRYGIIDPSLTISFSFMMVGFVAVSVSYIYGTLLTAGGKLKLLNKIAAFAVVLSLVLNFALIPKYHSMGAAFSSMCIQCIMAVLQIFIVIKNFKLKINYNLILSFVLFVITLVGLSYVIKNNISNLIFGVLATLLSGLFLSFVFQLLSFKIFYEIIKFKKV